ncbi:hypothetical protein ACRAWD_08395 [Caulobacter segnis]
MIRPLVHLLPFVRAHKGAWPGGGLLPAVLDRRDPGPDGRFQAK